MEHIHVVKIAVIQPAVNWKLLKYIKNQIQLSQWLEHSPTPQPININ